MQNNPQNVSLITYLCAAGFCVGATFIIFYLKYPPRLPYADEFQYLGYAYGLYKYGIFGLVKDPVVAPEATMFFPPLVPYFYSFFMNLNDVFAQTFVCSLQHSLEGVTGSVVADAKACSPKYGLIVPIQVLLSGLTVFFVWLLAFRLGKSIVVAFFSAFLALLAKDIYSYANYFLTETMTLFLAAGFGWALVCAWQDRNIKWAAICAVFFGLLVLTRAGWNYALIVVVPIFIVMAITNWQEKKLSAFKPIVVFLGVYVVVLSPWMIRNYNAFDTPALTASYGDMILSHRLPYNRMTVDEMMAAYVYWLPDFGDDVAAKLFPKAQYERLDFGAVNGFYQGVRFEMLNEIDQARGEQSRFSYMIEHEVIGNLPKHIAVTVAMVWRGMFVSKYWGLVAWCFYLPLLIWALYKKWGAFIVASLPPVFMMGLSAFVSVSIPRYNIVLIPILAFAVAYVLVSASKRLKKA